MMHLQSEADRMLARALHDAGQTDREIADGCQTSVNNVIWWRKDAGLKENQPPNPDDDPVPPKPSTGGNRPVSKRAKRDTPADFGMEPRQAAAQPPILVSPREAQTAYAAPVQPEGDNALEIGLNDAGKVFVDLDELLTTRLLVQGNSGSGKSHLLRRVIEESTGIVQQIVIDPEGDFVSLGETFGHTVIDAAECSKERLAVLAGRVRQHRASVVLDLSRYSASGDDDDDVSARQMEAAAGFITALFNAPKEHWHSALVFVDEAQVFAPSSTASLDVDKSVKRRSVAAMADLMCRGRKRGLAGVIATQRLAKLSTNIAAECSNFLMGRTFFDSDIARAADLLGLKPAQAQQIADLERGEFLGVGPAIARRPHKVKIGATLTSSPNASPGLAPLPSTTAEDLQSLLLAPIEPEEEDGPAPRLRVVS